MFSKSSPIPNGGAHRRRGLKAQLSQLALFLMFTLLPVALFANANNPPTGRTGAPGEGTCVPCHSAPAANSVSVTFPGTLTYTPGGAAQSLIVAVTGGSAGFELSARRSSDNSQAGSLTAGTGSNVTTASSVQYARQSSPGSPWTIQWTPPATNIGNVIVYVTGVDAAFSGYATSYTLTPSVVVPTQTIAAIPASLTFSYDGTTTTPSATQMVNVTSSGSPIAVTTSVSTTPSGGTWLTATPPGANTPFGVTVGVNPAGLAIGTYTGLLTLTSAAATNSPQTVGVTFNVTGVAPPPPPTLSLSPSSLTFNSPSGTPVTPQNVAVISSAAALAYTTGVTTASGGGWLSVSPTSGASGATGSTDSTLAVSVDSTILATLATGTYTGSVAFTAAGASNSPQTLNVTLKVGTPTLPPALRFSFTALDKDSAGTEQMLLNGQGSIDNLGKLTGSGKFTRFTPATAITTTDPAARRRQQIDSRIHMLATGRWKATSFIAFTPAPSAPSAPSASSSSGGTLEIGVELTPMGGTPMKGTMKIADTGTNSGVTVSIDGGATFVPMGTSHVTINTGTRSRGDRESDNERD